MVPATEFGPMYFPQYPQKLELFSHTTNTMLGLMQYPQRLGLFSHTTNEYHAQQPTNRQFRYSNRPIRCSTQLNRYYGRYHEQ